MMSERPGDALHPQAKVLVDGWEAAGKYTRLDALLDIFALVFCAATLWEALYLPGPRWMGLGDGVVASICACGVWGRWWFRRHQRGRAHLFQLALSIGEVEHAIRVDEHLFAMAKAAGDSGCTALDLAALSLEVAPRSLRSTAKQAMVEAGYLGPKPSWWDEEGGQYVH